MTTGTRLSLPGWAARPIGSLVAVTWSAEISRREKTEVRWRRSQHSSRFWRLRTRFLERDSRTACKNSIKQKGSKKILNCAIYDTRQLLISCTNYNYSYVHICIYICVHTFLCKSLFDTRCNIYIHLIKAIKWSNAQTNSADIFFYLPAFNNICSGKVLHTVNGKYMHMPLKIKV